MCVQCTGNPGYLKPHPRRTMYQNPAYRPNPKGDLKSSLLLRLVSSQYEHTGRWGADVGPWVVNVPKNVTYDGTEMGFHFRSGGDTIRIPIKTDPSNLHAVTYSVWVKTAVHDLGTNKGYIMSQSPDYGSSRALVLNDASLGGVSITVGEPWDAMMAKMKPKTWVHLVGVWEQGRRSSVFYDGKQGKEFRTTANGKPNVTVPVPGKYCSGNWGHDWGARTQKPLEDCQKSCDASPGCSTITVGTYKKVENNCVLCTSNQFKPAKWTTSYTNRGTQYLEIGGKVPLDRDHNPDVFISDVSVWGRALSSGEVLDLFKQGRPSTKPATPTLNLELKAKPVHQSSSQRFRGPFLAVDVRPGAAGTCTATVPAKKPAAPKLGEGVNVGEMGEPLTKGNDGIGEALAAKAKAAKTKAEKAKVAKEKAYKALPRPWWRVNLFKLMAIGNVTVVAAAKSVAGAQIRLTVSEKLTKNATVCGTLGKAGVNNFTIDCNGAVGKYLYIVGGNPYGSLSICDVHVHEAARVHCNYQCYLRRYPDLVKLLKNSTSNARVHYASAGKEEGRICTCPGAGRKALITRRAYIKQCNNGTCPEPDLPEAQNVEQAMLSGKVAGMAPGPERDALLKRLAALEAEEEAKREFAKLPKGVAPDFWCPFKGPLMKLDFKKKCLGRCVNTKKKCSQCGKDFWHGKGKCYSDKQFGPKKCCQPFIHRPQVGWGCRFDYEQGRWDCPRQWYHNLTARQRRIQNIFRLSPASEAQYEDQLSSLDRGLNGSTLFQEVTTTYFTGERSLNYSCTDHAVLLDAADWGNEACSGHSTSEMVTITNLLDTRQPTLGCSFKNGGQMPAAYWDATYCSEHAIANQVSCSGMCGANSCADCGRVGMVCYVENKLKSMKTQAKKCCQPCAHQEGRLNQSPLDNATVTASVQDTQRMKAQVWSHTLGEANTNVSTEHTTQDNDAANSTRNSSATSSIDMNADMDANTNVTDAAKNASGQSAGQKQEMGKSENVVTPEPTVPAECTEGACRPGCPIAPDLFDMGTKGTKTLWLEEKVVPVDVELAPKLFAGKIFCNERTDAQKSWDAQPKGTTESCNQDKARALEVLKKDSEDGKVSPKQSKAISAKISSDLQDCLKGRKWTAPPRGYAEMLAKRARDTFSAMGAYYFPPDVRANPSGDTLTISCGGTPKNLSVIGSTSVPNSGLRYWSVAQKQESSTCCPPENVLLSGNERSATKPQQFSWHSANNKQTPDNRPPKLRPARETMIADALLKTRDRKMCHRALFGETDGCSSQFEIAVLECQGCNCRAQRNEENSKWLGWTNEPLKDYEVKKDVMPELVKVVTEHQLVRGTEGCAPWFVMVDSALRSLVDTITAEASLVKTCVCKVEECEARASEFENGLEGANKKKECDAVKKTCCTNPAFAERAKDLPGAAC